MLASETYLHERIGHGASIWDRRSTKEVANVEHMYRFPRTVGLPSPLGHFFGSRRWAKIPTA